MIDSESLTAFRYEMLRQLIATSHLIILEELCSLHGRSFDRESEFARLMHERFECAKLFIQDDEKQRSAMKSMLEQRGHKFD